MENNPLKAEVGGKDRGFLLKFNIYGVFLTVFFQEKDGVPVFELTDITRVLFDRGITDYNMELIVQTIRAQNGTPVQIASFMPDEEEEKEKAKKKEPRLELRLSRDKMTAMLMARVDADTKPVSYNLIAELLNKSGVIFGISEAKIRVAVEKLKRDHTCEEILAEGIRPQNGRDAIIEDKFNLDKKNSPQILESGRVDYKNLNLFTIVSKGEILQERIPHTIGIEGRNVYGDTVAARPGKMKSLVPGKNVQIVEENKLVADIDGQVVKEGNRVSVVPIIQINGDVDLSTGNIDFNGSVHIRGNVQEGFSVKAIGDVNIDGSVYGGIVEGNDVTIRAGIQGMSHGKVFAKRDVNARFAENAVIAAGRNIKITDAILHSHVNAGKTIVVNGHRGVVVGGELAAGELLDMKTVGNQASTVMTVEVGVNPLLRKRITETKKEMKKAEKSRDDAQKALKILKTLPREQLSPNKQELLARLLRSSFTLELEIKNLKKTLEGLSEEVEALRDGKIRISEVIYPGVKIIIGAAVRSISEPIHHSTFYESEDEIRVGPY